MSQIPKTFEEAFDVVASEALAIAELAFFSQDMLPFDLADPEHLAENISPLMQWLRHRLWPGGSIVAWLRSAYWQRHPETDAKWNNLAGLALAALAAVEGRCPAESLRDLRALMVVKQADYSPANILDFGQIGCLVRANDKVRRLENLLTRRQAPRNEPIRDSWADLTNYCLIARMVRRGWFALPLAEAEEEREAVRRAA